MEGKQDGKPVLDWQGRPYNSDNGPAAHPNARFTVPMQRCPSYSDDAEQPQGVPISAVIFGGRRASLAPLVYEAMDWAHGVMVGASVASETTAAQTGAVGVVRRDPMAMKPFCGYNFADYWGHWLDIGKKLKQPPKLFHVNWFRKDKNDKFMWPGFGENMRVLEWILKRCADQVQGQQSPIGLLPEAADLNTQGLDLAPDTLRALIEVDPNEWRGEMENIGTYFEQYGDRLPEALRETQRAQANRLGS